LPEIWRDTFTDANGTDLKDHVPELGAGYTLTNGAAANAEIQSNTLQTVTVGGNSTTHQLTGLSARHLDIGLSVKRSGAGNAAIALLLREDSGGDALEVDLEHSAGVSELVVYGFVGADYFEVHAPVTWTVDTFIAYQIKLIGRRLLVAFGGVNEVDFELPFPIPGNETSFMMVRSPTGALTLDDLVINDEGVPGMIFVEDVDLMIPTEGTEAILEGLRSALCAGCAAGIGAGNPAATTPPLGDLTFALNTNAVDPTAGLAFADLALTDDAGGAPVAINGEAAPDYCIDGFEGPAIGGDGYWRLLVDQQIFTAAGGATTPPVITGVALILDGNRLLAYGPLAGGPANFETGDIVKLSAQMTLRPQMLLE